VVDEIDICKKIDPDVFTIAGCNLGESERETQVPRPPLESLGMPPVSFCCPARLRRALALPAPTDELR